MTRAKRLVILLVACSTAQASEWVPVAESTDGTEEVFVDVSSIRIDGNIRHAWEKLVPAHHTMKGLGEYAHKHIIYELTKVVVNCSEETAKEDAVTIYYEDGTNESLMPEVVHKKGWDPVPPDSVLSFEMKFICAWKPK
jgi:hypothetical protein